jgi:hypothetical protein
MNINIKAIIQVKDIKLGGIFDRIFYKIRQFEIILNKNHH